MARRKIDVRVRLEQRLVRQPNGCLELPGFRDKDGYGAIKEDGVQKRAHRVAWTLAHGPIPEGMRVLHHCDNPPCCETEPSEAYPEGHLFLGTNADNMADCLSKGRHGNQKKTHCPDRHEYTEANTYVHPVTGHRSCRTCMTTRGRANHLARYVPHPKVKNPYQNWSPSGWSKD